MCVVLKVSEAGTGAQVRDGHDQPAECVDPRARNGRLQHQPGERHEERVPRLLCPAALRLLRDHLPGAERRARLHRHAQPRPLPPVQV